MQPGHAWPDRQLRVLRFFKKRLKPFTENKKSVLYNQAKNNFAKNRDTL